MKYSCKISRYDAGRLFRLSDKFFQAEKKYREAQNKESRIREYLFQAQQELHLANLDRLSAGRAMSDIIQSALLDDFAFADSIHND